MNGETELVYAVEEFLLLLETRSYAYGTIKTRRWQLRDFVKYAHARGVTDARSVTGDFLRAYITRLEERTRRDGEKFKRSVIDIFAVSLRVFFRHLAQRGLLLFDPSRALPQAKHADERIPKVLSPVTTERVLALPDLLKPEGLRDRAILELLYSTAVRRAELGHLRIEDVRMESGTLYVRQGKGKKDRVVPAGERALVWVSKYLLEARPRLEARIQSESERDRETLFLGRLGRRLSENSLTNIGAKYNREAGVKSGSCHIFRHTCATEMLSNGADILHVQEMLGHTDGEKTVLYTHISPERLREKYVKTHPAAHGEITSGAQKAPVPARVNSNRPRTGKNGCTVVFPEGETGRAAAAYLDFRKLELAERSIQSFREYLVRFVRFTADRRVTGLTAITLPLLEGYQKHLSQRRKKDGGIISIKTQKYELEVVCSFVRWCFSQGLLLTDPSAAVVLPKIGFSIVSDVLTKDEAERVLSAPDTRFAYGMRDRAVLEILYASGIRSSEMTALMITDADFDRDALTVRAAKHGRNRVLPVSARAMKTVYRWVEEARGEFVRGEDPGYLFLSNRGMRLARGTLKELCRKYLDFAGIHKKQAVHIFRHSCAAHMIENGADLRTVQEYLGHRCLRSTGVYAHLTIKKLKEVHAATHPAEKRYLERLRAEDKPGLKGQVRTGEAKVLPCNQEMPA